MELLDVYNNDEKLTGRIIVRGDPDEKLSDDEFVLGVCVWLKSQDKYLLQKTSPAKFGRYAITGGCVSSGNQPFDQIQIECKEELNLTLDPSKLVMLGEYRIEHFILKNFLYEDDTLIDYPFVLQESEVESIMWLSKDEIDSILDDPNFRESSRGEYLKFIKDRE